MYVSTAGASARMLDWCCLFLCNVKSIGIIYVGYLRIILLHISRLLHFEASQKIFLLWRKFFCFVFFRLPGNDVRKQTVEASLHRASVHSASVSASCLWILHISTFCENSEYMSCSPAPLTGGGRGGEGATSSTHSDDEQSGERNECRKGESWE